MNINDVLKTIAFINGPDKQEIFPLEEMAELTKELMKRHRGKNNYAEIIEEGVDVLYTVRCLLYAYGADDNKIDEIMERKVKRLADYFKI